MSNVALHIDHPPQANVVGATSVLQVIERAAMDPSMDVDKLERLMGLYERMNASNAKAEYAAALASMQAEFRPIAERGKSNNSAYALWEDINEQIRPTLAKHGFSLTFRTGRDGHNITVTGVLAHRSGHSEETTMALPADDSGKKSAVQQIGSSTSYGKRYVAIALLNLTTGGEDDDGRAAGVGPVVSDAQADELIQLLRDAGADVPRFLQHFSAPSLSDFPAAKFSEARSTLLIKIRKSAQDQSAKGQANG